MLTNPCSPSELGTPVGYELDSLPIDFANSATILPTWTQQAQVSPNTDKLIFLADNYKAGNIASALPQWETLTSDKNILSIVKYGLPIQFESLPHPQTPYKYSLNAQDTAMVDREITSLLTKGAIIPTDVQPTDYFSPVFPRVNKDGTPRLLLNLKTLNAYVKYIHFKMESFQCVLNMLQQNCWMASIDLKSAFYSVPIHPKHQKYLKFLWDQPYMFVVMPNGYADAPRIFTKILKPVLSYLRSLGFCSVVFLDDSYLQGSTYAECLQNVTCTIRALQQLGFTIHPTKSILTPTQNIEFLGYIVDSVTMTITLPLRKKEKRKNSCQHLLQTPNPTIRTVASLIGNFVAATEAVPYARLHYHTMENEKISALATRKGDFDKTMMLSSAALLDVSWWLQNIDHQFRNITPIPIHHTIFCDASKQGWGAHCATAHAGGPWLQQEWRDGDINVMELTAANLALHSFCKPPCYVPEDPVFSGNRLLPLSEDPFKGNRQPTTHIRFMLDNTTAVSYINHMGGSRSLKCNAISQEMWIWAETHGIWLSAAHIPGIDNEIADHYSRHLDDTKEWTIMDSTFNHITSILGIPTIDLFASRINHKVTPYVSWHPDPGCHAVDAFSILWHQEYIYCFPPFSLVWRTLSKIAMEKVDALLIAPLWPMQSWYPSAIRMLVDHPIVFQASNNHLQLPHKPHAIHPLHPGLHLMALKLSGDSSKTTKFLNRLKTSSYHPGDHPLKRNMKESLGNGKHFVLRNTLIPFIQL